MKKNIIPTNALRMIWRKRYNGNLWGEQEDCNYVVRWQRTNGCLCVGFSNDACNAICLCFLYVRITNRWGLKDFMLWRTIKLCLTLFWIPVICNLYLAFNKALLHNYSVSILFSFSSRHLQVLNTRQTHREPTAYIWEFTPRPGMAFSHAQFVPLRNKTPAVRASNPSPSNTSLPRTHFLCVEVIGFGFCCTCPGLGLGKWGWRRGCAGLKGENHFPEAPPWEHMEANKLWLVLVTIYSFLSTAAKILHQVVSFWLCFSSVNKNKATDKCH